MCGITFYFNRKGISGSQLRESLSALQAIRHRGPDGEGVLLLNSKSGKSWKLATDETPTGTQGSILPSGYIDGDADIFLGHRRLSIFDLSIAGHQPMQDSYGNWIIFNGEIYNFPEIKEELKQKNHSFSTSTDTEVILSAYREWGPECLKKFNGMWALIIWDAKEKRIFISNDRFGVKGLYFHQNENEYIASSEVKGLLQFKGRKGEYNLKNIHQFLDISFLDSDSETFFAGFKRFPPAHFGFLIPAEGTGIKLSPNWIQPEIRSKQMRETEWTEKFREVLFDSTRLRMRSDAPWGISLSGGLDSSSLVYAAIDILKKEPTLANQLETFSCIFPGKEGDESNFIQIVQEDTGVKSHFVEPMKLFSMDEFSKHIWHQDFPVHTTSQFAEWCLMKITRSNNIKVLLTGTGGDELLAGYHHHFYRYLRELLTKFKFRKYKNEIKEFAALKNVSEASLKSIAWGELKQYLPYYFGKKIKNEIGKRHSFSNVEETLRHDFSTVMMPTYLRSEDRDSMAFGVETRNPFLDYRMVDLAMSMPTEMKIKKGWQKWILRNSMHELPSEIRWRKDKKGYSNPQKEWVKSNVDGFVDQLSELKLLDIEPKKDEIRSALLGSNHDSAFRKASLAIWLGAVRNY